MPIFGNGRAQGLSFALSLPPIPEGIGGFIGDFLGEMTRRIAHLIRAPAAAEVDLGFGFGKTRDGILTRIANKVAVGVNVSDLAVGGAYATEGGALTVN